MRGTPSTSRYLEFQSVDDSSVADFHLTRQINEPGLHPPIYFPQEVKFVMTGRDSLYCELSINDFAHGERRSARIEFRRVGRNDAELIQSTPVPSLDRELERLDSQAKATKQKLQRLLTLYEDGDLDKATYLARRNEHENYLHQINVVAERTRELLQTQDQRDNATTLAAYRPHPGSFTIPFHGGSQGTHFPEDG